MGSVMDEVLVKREKEAADNAILNNLKNLMSSMKWTAKQAMDALKIPAKEQKKYMAML